MTEHTTHDGSTPDWVLSPEDEHALDALIEAGFDLAAVPSGLRDRAERLMKLLGLTEAPVDATDRQTLIDITLATVSRHTSRRAGASEAMLVPDDEEALEALLGVEMDVERVPRALRARAERAGELLDLLDVSTGDDASRSTLVASTLARVQSAVEEEADRMSFEAASVGVPRRRLADLVSVAALLLIGVSVAFPMLSAIRHHQSKIACQGNLNQAGLGFGLYTSDFKDALPLASAAPAGNPWWFVNVSPERSNSANLYTSVSNGYISLEDLACAGNPDAHRGPSAGAFDWPSVRAVSYSYQNLFATDRPDASSNPELGIAVDKSPVVRAAMAGRPIDPFANSPNHDGRGQQVLMLHGGVIWTDSPVVNGDNIWLPSWLERAIASVGRPHEADPLRGTESPAGQDDTFVVP